MLVGNAIWIFWVIVGVVALIASFIHIGIVEGFDGIDLFDFLDDFFGDYAWVTFLTIGAIGAAIFGFLNWHWWATLLILIGVVIIVIIIAIIVHKKSEKELKEYEEASNEVEEIKEQTIHSCPNCGAKITKITTIDFYDHKTVKYVCEHCNSVLDKKTAFEMEHPDSEIEFYDLDDWEEEYFDACRKLDFKPHNHHSEKQLDRRVSSIEERIDNCEDVYDETDGLDQYDILNNAYDFFIDNADEIDEYLNENSKEEIQKRYTYYCGSLELEEDD